MNKELIPAVAYCRVSTDSRDQENSFENQKAFYLSESEKLGYKLNDEYGVDGIYADKGLSGKSIKNRPEFLQMIEDSKKGDFKVLLVKSIGRFSRNTEDFKKCLRELKKNGVYIHFITDNLKSNDTTSQFVIDVFSSLAEQELRENSNRIQFGLREAQRQGKWTSQPPFGYNRVNGYLEINVEESEVVKIIFEQYCNQGESLDGISKYLNAKGIKSKTGKSWQQSTIRRLLQNPIYKGTQIGFQYKMEDIFIELVRKTDDDERIIHQFEHLRIIDEQTFEATLQKIKERSDLAKSNVKYSHKNILSNLFYCGNCGASMKRMKRSDSKDKYYYVCSNRHRDKTFCDTYNYIIESDVFDDLKIEIQSKKDLEKTSTMFNIKQIYNWYIEKNLGNEFLNQLPIVNEKIEKLDKRKKVYLDLYADGDLTKEEYKKHKKELDNDLEDLLKTKNRIDNIYLELNNVEKAYNTFFKIINSFDENNMTNLELRKIINKIIITTKETTNKDLKIFWNSGLDQSFEDIINDYWSDSDLDDKTKEILKWLV